jgi:GNAT superfamily N-acetyltransferase
MDPFFIRTAEAADIEAMAGLLNRLFSLEQDFLPDIAKQRQGLSLFLDGCGKHRCLLVAEAYGRARGMVSAQIVISTAEGAFCALVEDLVVEPEYRGRGMGKALLKALEAWAVAHGLARLQLLADRNNYPALAFYRHCGWQNTRLICLRKHP